MQNERQLECTNEVDPVWYHGIMAKQRIREKEASYKEMIADQMEYVPITKVSEMIREDGTLITSSDSCDDKGSGTDDEGYILRRKILP